MIIRPQDTIEDILIRKASLFNLRSTEITKAIQNMEVPEYCILRRRFLPDKKIKARAPRFMTIYDLAVLDKTSKSSDYVIKVLSRMLAINNDQVLHLRFVRAYRYYLECIETLAAISKKFESLKIEPTKEEREAQIDRPNRGITAVVRKYVQIMNGAVSPDQVYDMEWSVVYEAFESTTNDIIEQRNMRKLSEDNMKRKSASRRIRR